MRMGRFLRQLQRVVSEEELLAGGDGVVVAVSGGADSVALLHGLAGLVTAGQMDLRLHVAHLNHQTRGSASDGDAAFVAALADRLGLAVTVESADIPAAAGAGGSGLEQAGRRARYAFFARVAREQACRAVATAHHADDNAETILHRIIRGTGPRGLAGIPIRRPLAPGVLLADGRPVQLVRPMLRFRRRLIRQLCRANGLAFREDATNLDPGPTRNWIRHELIPLLTQVANPGFTGALLRLGELSGWVDAFVQETARRALGGLIVERTDMELSLNAASLARKRRILQAEVIRQAVLLLGPAEAEVGMRHLKSVMKLAEGPAGPKQVDLPGQMRAERRGGLIVLTRPSRDDVGRCVEAEPSLSLSVNLPGVTELAGRGLRLEIGYEENEPGLLASFRAAKGAEEELIDAERLCPPLLVRAWRAGDRFWPLGAPGSKKVGDFMTDRKVPAGERGRICLLCDRLGPIWVIGLRLDERVRVTERSRRLARLRVRPAEE